MGVMLGDLRAVVADQFHDDRLKGHRFPSATSPRYASKNESSTRFRRPMEFRPFHEQSLVSGMRGVTSPRLFHYSLGKSGFLLDRAEKLARFVG
jgi:hypothetical protein